MRQTNRHYIILISSQWNHQFTTATLLYKLSLSSVKTRLVTSHIWLESLEINLDMVAKRVLQKSINPRGVVLKSWKLVTKREKTWGIQLLGQLGSQGPLFTDPLNIMMWKFDHGQANIHKVISKSFGVKWCWSYINRSSYRIESRSWKYVTLWLLGASIWTVDVIWGLFGCVLDSLKYSLCPMLKNKRAILYRKEYRNNRVPLQFSSFL